MEVRDRIAAARLYLVTDARTERGDLEQFLAAALRGGVDIVQLRDKSLTDDEIVRAASKFRKACDQAQALFILNDRPDLVSAANADGVHVGQDDTSVVQAREVVGPDRMIGTSTHSPDQAATANADPNVDYLAAGPVHETPTKPGRPAVGCNYIEHVANTVNKPWFAIGGLNASNTSEVLTAGATRIVVVRAITDSSNPEASARDLKQTLKN